MSRKTFKEYLDQKGELQKKPIVDPLANTGPDPTPRPPKAVTKGKNWKNYTAEAAAVKDDTETYKAPGIDPGQQKYEKGLVDQGNKDLIYNPKTEDQRLKTSISKTEAFIAHTKNMTPQEYAEFALKNYEAGSLKKINEVVASFGKNGNLFETFIREIKRQNLFSELMSTMLAHQDTYDEIAHALANQTCGKEVSKNLAKSINQITAENSTEKVMNPEQNLIEALVKHTAIKNSVSGILYEEFGRKFMTLPKAMSEAIQLANNNQLNMESLVEIARRHHMNAYSFKELLLKSHPELAERLA